MISLKLDSSQLIEMSTVKNAILFFSCHWIRKYCTVVLSEAFVFNNIQEIIGNNDAKSSFPLKTLLTSFQNLKLAVITSALECFPVFSHEH